MRKVYLQSLQLKKLLSLLKPTESLLHLFLRGVQTSALYYSIRVKKSRQIRPTSTRSNAGNSVRSLKRLHAHQKALSF